MTRGSPRSRRARVVRVFLVAAVVALLLSGVALVLGRRSSGFYLVIGASAARGFEPTGSMGPRGPNEAATTRGYANDVDAILAGRGQRITLKNVSCPGETISTFLDGGDPCSHSSQLQLAEDYLRQNSGERGVVTIDIGFNDIRPCLQFASVDESCVARSLALVRRDLPRALAGLRAAAGSGVTLIGVPYGDPFLGHYLNPALGPANAAATLRAMERLDAALDAVYRSARVRVAPVQQYLGLTESQMTDYEGRRVPENVAEACATTWMCRSAPWGPNDHPNDVGYADIAAAIVREVPPSL